MPNAGRLIKHTLSKPSVTWGGTIGMSKSGSVWSASTTAGMAIPSSDRYVLVGIIGQTSGLSGIASVTINGSAATKLINNTDAGNVNRPVAFYTALVPSGTSVTVAVTESGTTHAFMFYGIWTITGGVPDGSGDTATGNNSIAFPGNNVTEINVNKPTNELVVAIVNAFGTTQGFHWDPGWNTTNIGTVVDWDNATGNSEGGIHVWSLGSAFFVRAYAVSSASIPRTLATCYFKGV